MFREIGMIGRDKICEELYPRCKGKKPPFILKGIRGVGKTALLRWAYMRGEEPKAFVSAAETFKKNLMGIVKGWGLAITRGDKKVTLQRATSAELEYAILTQNKGSIYIDDLNAAKPTFLIFLKTLRERFKIFAAGVSPLTKEGLNPIMWGIVSIRVPPIDKKHRLEFAEKACKLYGSKEAPSELAQVSRGYPARLLGMAQGAVEVKTPRVRGEEIDLSPVLLLLLAGIAALRYVGRGMDDTALYLIGGMGVALVLVLRFFLFRGMR